MVDRARRISHTTAARKAEEAHAHLQLTGCKIVLSCRAPTIAQPSPAAPNKCQPNPVARASGGNAHGAEGCG
eukprot:6550942-Prymnesium_polylepis.1